jgi:tetratricopeptide (TPR) repeat protein/transglutaminase-like putative cysteine protease
MPLGFRSRLLLAVSLCLTSPFLSPMVSAQIAAWPFEGPAFSASPVEIAAAASKIVPEKFADATVLYEESRYKLDADGRVTTTHRLVYRIEAASAVQSWSEAAVQWTAFYQKQPVIRARVIGRDSHVAELDAATLTDVPARNEGDGTYSDERVRKGPLPALSAGSIVEVETQLVDTEPFFRGGGVYRVYLQRFAPVVRSRVVIEAPTDLPLEYRLTDLPDVAVRKEEASGMRSITFDQGHIDPVHMSDIALATPDVHSPIIQFSTGKSWAAVAESYRVLSDPQIHPEMVKSLLPAPGLSRQATIAALVARLHKEVRYTGIEFGESKLQPQPASEVLKRHYGDCKDKATLLVAMLRAAGVPADLALLDAGVGMDVRGDLPGMNQFNHAIVYVPAAGSEPPLWIDATAEFSAVGTLPYEDRGRNALIIADGTQALTTTPAAKPEDSLLIEARNFELPGYGPSHVTVTSTTEGDIDSFYRAVYGGAENKQVRENLTEYVRNTYEAKDLASVEHGEGGDFGKPFTVRLDIPGARRGLVTLADASVYIQTTGLLDRLPRWFGVDPNPQGHQMTADEETERQKAEHQRSSVYQVHPFITEWRYTITPPAGFAVRALPPSRTTQMGPATLSEQYSVAEKTGIVTAVLRFNTGKELYSPEDAIALRTAVLALYKGEATGILFDQVGAKLLAVGKTREGLAADQKLIDQEPKDGLHYAQMAYALVHAGVGDMARAEARKAVALNPNSAIAYAALGEVLQYNEIGVQFAPGFDLEGAKAAYRKACELDPEETTYRLKLAITEEYDTQGIRYAADADLPAAIADYRALFKQDKQSADSDEDYLLFALFYARRFDELLKELEAIPGSQVRHGFAIAAVTALKGAPAGIERANQLGGGSEQRTQALRTAGGDLVQLSLFPLAADILAAASQGSADASTTSRSVEVLRSLKPLVLLPETDPAAPVQQFVVAALRGPMNEAILSKILARHAYTEASWKVNLKKNEQEASSFVAMAKRSGSLPTSLADISLGTMKLNAQGDDATGYRVTGQSIGSPMQHFFVVKEDGHYRVAASTSDFAEVGTEALYLLAQGQEKQARSLLDWKRELLHKGGGDDPLSGPLMPRFWTVGESGDIKLAAASLLTADESIGKLLPYIESRKTALAATGSKEDRASLDLLLSYAYLRVGDAAHAQSSSQALLAAYPDSPSAIGLAGRAYGLTRNYSAWNAMIASRVARHPDDRELLALSAQEASAEGDFARARKSYRAILDGGQAEVEDYNQYAWLTLFGGPVDAQAVEAAQQANSLTKNANFSILHTLACVYAAQGKAAEARQSLLQGMDSANMSTPSSPAWYALGAIYEDYGLADAARAAYLKVEKPDYGPDPLDTYVLAQRKLKP